MALCNAIGRTKLLWIDRMLKPFSSNASAIDRSLKTRYGSAGSRPPAAAAERRIMRLTAYAARRPSDWMSATLCADG
jgi:hypothetical protein